MARGLEASAWTAGVTGLSADGAIGRLPYVTVTSSFCRNSMLWVSRILCFLITMCCFYSVVFVDSVSLVYYALHTTT